jgi:hypothetical protein
MLAKRSSQRIPMFYFIAAHAGAACRQGSNNGQLPNSYSQLNAQDIWVFGSIIYFTSGSHTAFYPDKYALVIGVIISTRG